MSNYNTRLSVPVFHSTNIAVVGTSVRLIKERGNVNSILQFHLLCSIKYYRSYLLIKQIKLLFDSQFVIS